MGLEWGTRRRRPARPVRRAAHRWLRLTCGAHLCERCGLAVGAGRDVAAFARYRCVELLDRVSS